MPITAVIKHNVYLFMGLVSVRLQQIFLKLHNPQLMKLFGKVTPNFSVAKGRAIYLRDARPDPSCTAGDLYRIAIEQFSSRAGSGRR